MIEALKQIEAGRSAEEVGRQYGVSQHTIYAWKAKYGGMEVSEVQELKQPRDAWLPVMDDIGRIAAPAAAAADEASFLHFFSP